MSFWRLILGLARRYIKTCATRMLLILGNIAWHDPNSFNVFLKVPMKRNFLLAYLKELSK